MEKLEKTLWQAVHGALNSIKGLAEQKYGLKKMTQQDFEDWVESYIESVADFGDDIGKYSNMTLEQLAEDFVDFYDNCHDGDEEE